MRRLLTLSLAALAVATSVGAGAATAQPHGQYPQGRHEEWRDNRQDERRDDRRDDRRDRRHDSRYGQWNGNWGHYPSPPPRHWKGRHNGWYGHVRSCQIRYRSYSPARDLYFTGRIWTRCRL